MNLDRIFSRLILILTPAFITAILLVGLSCSSGEPNQTPVSSVPTATPLSTGTPPGTQPPIIPSSPVQLVQNVQNTPEPVYSPEPESFVPSSDVAVIGLVMESPPQF